MSAIDLLYREAPIGHSIDPSLIAEAAGWGAGADERAGIRGSRRGYVAVARSVL